MSGDILSARFRNIFEESLSPMSQRQAVDTLKDYIAELKHGTDEQRRELGVLCAGDVDPDVIEWRVQAALEKCYWQLVMLLRYSRPSRIAEAEPYLRTILSKMHARPTPSPAHLHEIHTALYLAAALAASSATPSTPTSVSSASSASNHLTPPSLHLSPYSAVTTPDSSVPSTPPSERTHMYPSREGEALSLFARAFALYDAPSSSPSPSPQKTPETSEAAPPYVSPPIPHALLAPELHPHNRTHHSKILGPKTELWARASYAALLRRLGRQAEASEVVQLIRSYIIHHPYALPSEKYHRLLQEIERDFSIDLLDATLSLETDVALGLTVDGDTKEIEHVEDVENRSEVISEGENEDEDEEDVDEVSDEDVTSPALSISPPSSDSESSADSSLLNSPITPSSAHFPPNLFHVEHPGAVLQNDVHDHRVVDQVTKDVRGLSLSGTEAPASTRQCVDDDGLGRRGIYPVVQYGAI